MRLIYWVSVSEPNTSAFNVEFCPYGMCSGGMVVCMSCVAGCLSLVSHTVSATTCTYCTAMLGYIRYQVKAACLTNMHAQKLKSNTVASKLVNCEL